MCFNIYQCEDIMDFFDKNKWAIPINVCLVCICLTNIFNELFVCLLLHPLQISKIFLIILIKIEELEFIYSLIREISVNSGHLWDGWVNLFSTNMVLHWKMLLCEKRLFALYIKHWHNLVYLYPHSLSIKLTGVGIVKGFTWKHTTVQIISVSANIISNRASFPCKLCK